MKGIDDDSPSLAECDDGKTSQAKWLQWAENTYKDESIRQAFKQPALRAAIKQHSPSSERHSCMRMRVARLSAMFTAQLREGCKAGPCEVVFCRGNARYTRRLQRLEGAAVESLALELAQRAAENPEQADIQPHTDAQLGRSHAGQSSTHAGTSNVGSKERSFAQTFNARMRRALAGDRASNSRAAGSIHEPMSTVAEALLGAATKSGLAPGIKVAKTPPPQILSLPPPLTTLAAPPGVLGSESSVAILRLDAQTAHSVIVIDGQLMCNTMQAVFGSADLLSQCFIEASDRQAPFSMDLPTALRFSMHAASKGAACIHALRPGIAEIDARLRKAEAAAAASNTRLSDSEADALARALGTAAMVLALVVTQSACEDVDRAELQRRVGRLVLRITYFTEPLSAAELAQGWQVRFARDSRMRRQWLRWWARMPAVVVQLWVRPLQLEALDTVKQLGGLVSSDYEMAQRVAANPLRHAGALELLRLLSDANHALMRLGAGADSMAHAGVSQRLALPHGHIGFGRPNVVSLKEFRDRRLLACFDLRHELLRWINAMRERSRQQQDDVNGICDDSSRGAAIASDRRTALNIFSPFAYPFLFGLADKIKLLAAEMHARMAQRYLGAHDRQAELVQQQRVLGIDPVAESEVYAGVRPQWPLLAASTAAVSQASSPYLVLSVHRSRLLLDTVDMLSAARGRVRFPLKVRFIMGGEDGLDMGGVQKELFAQLLPQLLTPERGLFEVVAAGRGYLWPNAASPHSLADFETVGMLLGIAFANGITLDSATAPLAPMLAGLLAHSGPQQPARFASVPLAVFAERMQSSFPELVSGLLDLLQWDESNGSVEEIYCRSFEITVPDPLRVWHMRAEAATGGETTGSAETAHLTLRPPFAHLPLPITADSADTVTFPLVDSGSTINVTAANRAQYVRRYLEFIAFEHARAQIDALRSGFMRAADSVVYRMLWPSELVVWLGGGGSGSSSANGVSNHGGVLDVSELQRIAGYDDEYTAVHPIVQRFWRVVGLFSQEQLCQLLAFVTASDRLPLGGYDNITFVIQRNGPHSDRLPTSLTCFGRLLLPAYESDPIMRSRLLTAIENSSGFGLV
ncbi:hypothetical protein GGF37_001139 [Kickxella alabastrina]|nr:hypothetical protein GGF37_001139 [Kickxella alabastrina]